MKYRGKSYHAWLLSSAAATAIMWAGSAAAEDAQFNIAPQPLASALNEFSVQSKQSVLFTTELAQSKASRGVSGQVEVADALSSLLAGTGLTYRRTGNTFLIVDASDPQSGSAAGDGAEGTVQALIVTAQKREEDIQDVPIAISAFTQEDLTRSQVAGGPDLMTQVPNFTFTKTNFSSYSIQIRGIGTQAISATTDPAVAIAFNNTPFVRNRFFEQEFYDLQRIEVLRGPQGTLYGRNATAGVVNIISAKPSFGFESRLSADMGNYNSTRLEGMVNVPLVDGAVALRLAGAWTKRDGYSTNEITGNPIDGRDLWSTRASLRVSPNDRIDANLIWEHFEENDDRLRSGKQLCHQDDREVVGGLTVSSGKPSAYVQPFSQGCIASSLYSPDSFEAPNGWSIPYFKPLAHLDLPINDLFNPYMSQVQSRDLRVIESTVDPEYTAHTDVVQLQASFDLTKDLTLSSETAYSYDEIFSKQDYNRFNTASGAFDRNRGSLGSHRPDVLIPGPNGDIFCDPQIGCADRLVAVDVSTARSRQFSQELRLSSNFDGPFNFSLGANFLRYDTYEKYYVFINTLTLFAAYGDAFHAERGYAPYVPGVTDNHECFVGAGQAPDPTVAQRLDGCIYIDPNPIGSLNDLGHNYFLSKNPYKLISYAAFGEAYYNLAENLKVTAGLRWTVDKKEAPRIPSWVLAADTIGYPVTAVEEQEWREPTGRLAIDWKPDLSFTDETLLYASLARGYKAGGANPPPAGTVTWIQDLGSVFINQSATRPKTFEPEFVNAFEVGAKNTMLNGALTLNLAGFYYDYTGYQISQIVDRSATNYNFDATVWGLEIETDWRPLENLRLAFKGGYENTRVADGMRAVDVMDRTAGHDDWVVVRPFPTYTSNCIIPANVFDSYEPGGVATLPADNFANGVPGPCEFAYALNVDPVTNLPYVADPTVRKEYVGQNIVPLVGYDNYPGFNPESAPNHGEGFYKDLSGNELPNAPHFTATITADYTLPLSNNWLATLHTDLYYQSEAWTRVFNMPGYDKLKAYTNVNLAAIFTNDAAGWKVMAYVKNVFDRDSITGAFLNSDDTGLTTNVFLTEPRLYGLRVTKEWNGGAWWSNDPLPAGKHHPWALEVGGMLQRHDAPYDPVRSAGTFSGALDPALIENRDLDLGQDASLKLTYAPGQTWRVSAAVRYGKAKGVDKTSASQAGDSGCQGGPPLYPGGYDGSWICNTPYGFFTGIDWARTSITNTDEYAFVDFEVGRDFGVGTVSAGLRYADIQSKTLLDLQGVPDWNIPDEWAFIFDSTHHYYDTHLVGDREFKGFGPTLSWDVSHPLVSSPAGGALNVDAKLSGGVLFGRQRTSVKGSEMATYYSEKYRYSPALPDGPPQPTAQHPAVRSKSATVPTAAAELGLSYEIQRFKLNAGYRWERYYDVLDAGFAERKEYDRTLDGPYLRLSVGFGGG